MIDTEILRLVDAILEPELAAQGEALAKAIGEIEIQAASNGFGQSSTLFDALFREGKRALNERADIVWSTIEKVVSNHELAWSTRIREDLRVAWRDRFEPLVEKLALDLEYRAGQMKLGKHSLPDLAGEAARIAGKTEAAIELFERQLRQKPPRCLQPNVITEETYLQLDGDTIKSGVALGQICRSLFDCPGTRVFLYERDGEPNATIKGAIDAGDLFVGNTELYFYKSQPGPIFTRIDPNTTDPRERGIFAAGPLYRRRELNLSPKKKRHLETVERLQIEKDLDDDAGLELKPGWMGLSIDLRKLLRWFRRRLGR